MRRRRTRKGRIFDGFNAAIGREEANRIRHEMRSWRLGQHTNKTLVQLAEWVNPRVQGWIN